MERQTYLLTKEHREVCRVAAHKYMAVIRRFLGLEGEELQELDLFFITAGLNKILQSALSIH